MNVLIFRIGTMIASTFTPLSSGLRAKPEIEEFEIDTNEEKCVYCSSLNIVKNDSRKTAIENKQRFKCKDCGKVRQKRGNIKMIL